MEQAQKEAAKPQVRDLKFWTEYIQKQNGNSFLLPEKFKAGYDNLERMRTEFQSLLLEASKMELKFKVAQDSLMLQIREDAEINGIKDIWTKDIGFHETAKKDGFAIVNLVNPIQRQ